MTDANIANDKKKDVAAEPERLGKVIVVSNGKGGVVKSFSLNEQAVRTRNLRKKIKKLRRAGRKVLIIDCDFTAGLTQRNFRLGLPPEISDLHSPDFNPGPANSYRLFMPRSDGNVIAPYELANGVYIMGATAELNEINLKNDDCLFDFRDNIEWLRKQFDYIYVDTHQSYSNVFIACHMAADYLLVPTLLEEESLRALERQLQHMKKIKQRYNPGLKFLGTYVTQTEVLSYKKDILDGYLTAIDTDNVERMIKILEAQGYGIEQILGFISYVKTTVKEAIMLGQSLYEYAPKSRPAEQYAELTETVIELIEGDA